MLIAELLYISFVAPGTLTPVLRLERYEINTPGLWNTHTATASPPLYPLCLNRARVLCAESDFKKSRGGRAIRARLRGATVWSMPLCRVLWFFSINYLRHPEPFCACAPGYLSPCRFFHCRRVVCLVVCACKG